MTDTGRSPGEGQPESAGAPQEGVAPAGYAYTPPAPVDHPNPGGHAAHARRGARGQRAADDLLLMPSAQGAWGDPGQQGQSVVQPPVSTYPPAQQPSASGSVDAQDPQAYAAPTPHYPDGHQVDGRDSGVHDYGAVRTPPQGSPIPDTDQPVAHEGAVAAPPDQDASAAPLADGPNLAARPVASATDAGQDTAQQGGPDLAWQPAAPGGGSTTRRPLHLGPPVPEQSGTVRPLSERGPSQPAAGGARPMSQAPAPAPTEDNQDVTAEPEYLDGPYEPNSAYLAADPTGEAADQLPGPQLGALPPQPGGWSQPPPVVEPSTVGEPGAEGTAGETGQPHTHPLAGPDLAAVPPVIATNGAQHTAESPEGIEPTPVADPATGGVPAAPDQLVADEPAVDAPASQPAATPFVTPPTQATEAPSVEAPAVEQPAGASVEAGEWPEAVAEPSVPTAEQQTNAWSVPVTPQDAGPETAQQPEPEQQLTDVRPETGPDPTVRTVPAPRHAEAANEPAPATEESVSEDVPASAPADVAAPADAVQPEPEPEPVTEPEPEPVTEPEPEPSPEAAEPPPAESQAIEPPAVEAATADAGASAAPEAPPAPGYSDTEREAVHRAMRERRDVRQGFRPDPIPHEVLLRVLEAAHTAPSVGHSQPWDFVIIRSEETRRSLHELATRQRDAYARTLPKGRAKQFKELQVEAILDTPVNIVVTADPTRGGRHPLGQPDQQRTAPYSSALAVENLWLASRAEGLGVGWVNFYDEREMVRELGLPEHLEVVAYLCVGYVDAFPDEPEPAQPGWSSRRPLSWVVHEEAYGRRVLPGAEAQDLLSETLAAIRPLDAKALGEAWERQKRMTKPSGALGMLEIISAQLSGLARQCPPPVPEPAAVAVFAGDHGVHAQQVTPWPQQVTAQMVGNFLSGGAVCNAFAHQVGAEVCVVDVGVASPLPSTPGLLPRKVRPGTADFTVTAAMTRGEAKRAVEVGIETARDLVASGNRALLTGEMGIANTTVSAALIAVYTGADPAEVTGRGTGVSDETHSQKIDVVRRALELHQADPADPLGVLAALGGLEHAALVGLILGGASLRTPVILDGVSAGAAALVARAMAPEALAACVAGHRSPEPGHHVALATLGLRPLVDLDLRLGEGTGALLALPVVQSAARAMHDVATFDAAGVTEKN